MQCFTDQLGNRLTFENQPQRIVSLVPSQSEFLWDLGIVPVGITKFCVHPAEMYRSVERVGGTRQLDLQKIRQLQPDLIVANKEENDAGQIRELQKEFRVWVSDIATTDAACEMMEGLAAVTGRQEKGAEILAEVKRVLQRVKNSFNGERVAYFIWKDPYMLAGRDTFIHALLDHLGFVNCAASQTRYPEVDRETLRSLAPAYCFLSSEPFPFRESHAHELAAILPGSHILFTDGEMFSWYGSRLMKLEAYAGSLQKQLRESGPGVNGAAL